MSSKYRVTKGFKFHARPQTGAYSCLIYDLMSVLVFLGGMWKDGKQRTCNEEGMETVDLGAG